MKQCAAITQASTYTKAHRCVKKTAPKRAGRKTLCAHHLSMAARRRP